MNSAELRDRLSRGEDTHSQFKRDLTSIDGLAAEITAFANCEGGVIIVGVADDGDVVGISADALRRLNQWVSNATSQKIEPPLFVKTEALLLAGKRILLIHVPQGGHKPYAANRSDYWVKNGADKRRATREELFRLMQSSGALFADEMPSGIGVEHFDMDLFEESYRRYYGEFLDPAEISSGNLLENLRLSTGKELTLAGALLFSKSMATARPQFAIKATHFLEGDGFADKEDITGRLLEQYRGGVEFVKRNLHRTPSVAGDFNAPGELEIPLGALKEILANALIHRDYFVQSSIFVGIYPDRVEVSSPGRLPNGVTIDSMKVGIHIERNPILLSFAAREKDFGYTGRGSGIPRVIRLCRDYGTQVDFVNDVERNQFRVVFGRKQCA